MKLETNRLIIEEININDKYGYFINIANNKEVLKTFIDKYVEKYEDFNFERYLKIKDFNAIKLRDTNEFIGVILIVENKGDEVEVGYAIGEKYWNNGYTTEAFKKYIEYLFNDRNIKIVYASFFDTNIASKRVMEKSGLIFDHIEYESMEYLGEKKNLVYYRIMKKDM